MTKTKDDLEAVRAVTSALEGFDASEQERIIRWSREKLGLTAPREVAASTKTSLLREQTPDTAAQEFGAERSPDIQTFAKSKNPRTDSQFAATVAYYYRFEAPEKEKKNAITKDDLQEACRKVGRERFNNPLTTLFNTFKGGLLDKGSEKGSFSINSVGENLVAMALPGGDLPKKPSDHKNRKSGRRNRARAARKAK